MITLINSVFGQITLENIYPNVHSVPKHFQLIKLDNTTFKYVIFDPLNSQFTLYNLDHSVYLNVNIPITYVAGSSQYQIAFVSKSLFDCNSENIEYGLSFLGNGMPNTYPKHFYVYRTDGTQLADIDSCSFMNFSDGWKYGPEYNKPIVNTPVGTKLLLRCIDGSSRVYSVCGNLPSETADIFENDLLDEPSGILGNPFPNPTNNLISIPYFLPENEERGIIKIYDADGQEIKSYNIDSNFNNITLSTSEFSSGTYYYQLVTSKGQVETKKIIKVD